MVNKNVDLLFMYRLGLVLFTFPDMVISSFLFNAPSYFGKLIQNKELTLKTRKINGREGFQNSNKIKGS